VVEKNVQDIIIPANEVKGVRTTDDPSSP